MSIDTLLEKLDGVRKTGSDRWVAKCPAHADARPSLALRQVDDGRVLIHCFAGCNVEEVLGSVGLDFDALYPERLSESKPIRRPFSSADALRCITGEAVLVALAASDLAQGKPLSEDLRARLVTAAGRINHALDVALA